MLERTRDAVIRLQERGVQVIIASGRAPNGVYPVAEAFELPRFGSHILAFNGAKMIRLQDRACIYEKTLPSYIPEELWADAQNYHLGFLTYKDDILAAGTKPDRYMALESQSGQLPIDPATGSFPSGDIKDQTKMSLENIKAILAAAGLTMANVVKTTVLLDDIGNFAAMNEVYGSYFADPYPARAAFEVAKLPKGAKVEIEVIAVR